MRFAAVIFDVSPAMLMVRADQPVTRTERFEREVLPHLAGVYRAALCLTGDPGAAEDLAAEAFARAYRAFPPRPSGSGLEAWLYRVLARTRREQRPAERPAVCDAPGDQPPVWRALRALPEDLRFAVHLADVNGFSYAEIAEITGTSAVTVATRLRGARRSLRHRLSPIPEQRP